eukprot:1994686-Pleurochrysis_carterae.AAC.1
MAEGAAACQVRDGLIFVWMEHLHGCVRGTSLQSLLFGLVFAAPRCGRGAWPIQGRARKSRGRGQAHL